MTRAEDILRVWRIVLLAWSTLEELVASVTATALITAIGDVTQCKNGRQLAAWLGLVPREYSTGGKPRLVGMSQRIMSFVAN